MEVLFEQFRNVHYSKFYVDFNGVITFSSRLRPSLAIKIGLKKRKIRFWYLNGSFLSMKIAVNKIFTI